MPLATRARRKPVQRERSFHMTVARYLDKALPASCWYSTFPSGGGGKARGGQLKACGLKAGVFDILILFKEGDQTTVIWLELKSKAGSLSDEQKAFAARMSEMPGVKYGCFKTLEDLEYGLGNIYGIPLRAKVAA